MRGEHVPGGIILVQTEGSSPHARGARVYSYSPFAPLRIIPACAGSTGGANSRLAVRPDHPRMRGEHNALTTACPWWPGSSPHARGAPVFACCRNVGCGIIPACAGSTRLRASCRQQTTDHPRMRGEHVYHPSPTIRSMGSSPHARGAPFLVSHITSPSRIIPACAGSTTSFRRVICLSSDHPRMRGEHTNKIKDIKVFVGSSPHARGALG